MNKNGITRRAILEGITDVFGATMVGGSFMALGDILQNNPEDPNDNSPSDILASGAIGAAVWGVLASWAAVQNARDDIRHEDAAPSI